MNVDVVDETAPKRNDLFISSLRGLGWGAESIVTHQRTDICCSPILCCIRQEF